MIIELKDVRKVFNQGKPNEFAAIQGISLSIEPDKVTCLKGSSGSGKTTLLSMIGCLSRPTSGRISLGDKVISGLPERFVTDIRRHTFGFIFQRFNLIQGLSVLENVMVPAYPLAPDHKALKASALTLLERFNLASKAENPVEWLSGGEAQRVAVTVDPAPMGLLYNDPTLPSYEEVRWSRTERLDHPTFIERLDALMDQYTVS